MLGLQVWVTAPRLTKTSFNRWTDRLLSQYHQPLFSNKKEQTIHLLTHQYRRTYMYFAMWKKSTPNVYILYNFIHITFWRRQNYRSRKQIRGCPQLGEREGVITKASHREFQGDAAVLCSAGWWTHVSMGFSKPTKCYTTKPHSYFLQSKKKKKKKKTPPGSQRFPGGKRNWSKTLWKKVLGLATLRLRPNKLHRNTPFWLAILSQGQMIILTSG